MDEQEIISKVKKCVATRINNLLSYAIVLLRTNPVNTLDCEQ